MTGPFLPAAPAAAAIRSRRLECPAGRLILRESDGAITRLHWMGPASASDAAKSGEDSPLLAEAARQLAAYFAGERQDFDLPLAPAGSAFHKDVWRLMCEIPFGKTATYGDLARQLESAAQPVGSACGANPIAILIPCHRVVAASGLGGFSGGVGVESKRFLLHHEGALEPELDLFS